MAGTWKLLRRVSDGVVCCKHYKNWTVDPSVPTAWIGLAGVTHEMVNDPDGTVMSKQLHRQDFDPETCEPGPLVENWKIIDGAWQEIP